MLDQEYYVCNLNELQVQQELNKIYKDQEHPNVQEQWVPTLVEGMHYSVDFDALFLSRNRKTDKIKLARLFKAIEQFKHIRRNTGNEHLLTLLYLSTHEDRIFKTILNQFNMNADPQSVKNEIEFAEKLGILRKYDSFYRFNLQNPKDNICQQYTYSYIEEQRFLNWIEESEILKDFNWFLSKKKVLKKISKEVEDKIRIGSNLRIYRPFGMDKDQFEQIVKSVVYEKYPMILDTKNKIDELNIIYDNIDNIFHLKMDLNITWNKGNYPGMWINKLSIRLTSPACNIVKDISLSKVINDPNSLNQRINAVYQDRKEICKKFGFNGHYDVNGSVPFLTKSLNEGYIEFTHKDIYMNMENIYNKLINSKPSKEVDQFTIYDLFDTVSQWDISDNEKDSVMKSVYDKYYSKNKIARSTIKSLFMGDYFDTSVAANANHLKRRSVKSIHNIYNDNAVANTLATLHEAIETEIGQSFKAEIFLHESCIYLDVTKKLLEQGHLCMQIYDCWYYNSNGKSAEYMHNLIESLIEESFNNYISEYYDSIYRSRLTMLTAA